MKLKFVPNKIQLEKQKIKSVTNNNSNCIHHMTWKETKSAPEQYASGNNLQITHYLIRRRIHISQRSKLNIVMN